MNSKKTITKKLSFLLLMVPSFLMAFSGLGSGTTIDPYQITSLTQLQEMKDDLTAHYRLMNDIDALPTRTWNLDSTGVYQGFEPIASSGTFTGSIHGGGFVISGLTIKRNLSFVGLIGRGQGVEIDSLGLEGVNIINAKKNSSGVYSGGLIAYGDTIDISSSFVTGTVGIDNIESDYSYSSHHTGGIAGSIRYSKVVKSYANVAISARAYAASPFVGHAYNDNTFENNYSNGSVSNKIGYYGGLFGWLYGPLSTKNNYSTADSLRAHNYLYDNNDVVHSNYYLDSITQNSATGFSGKIMDSLQSISIFTDTTTAGLDSAWDFVGNPNDDTENGDIWKLGEGYPYLYWMSDSLEINFIANSNGTITGSASQKIATGTETAEVTATPNSGYTFLEWSDGNKNANRMIKNAGVNSSLTAYFATSISLTYSSGSNGSVEGDTSQVVAQGTNGKSVLAVADSGYFFAGWSDGRMENPRLDSNAQVAISVSAQFGNFPTGLGTAENPYEITTLIQLQGMRSFLNSHFILMNDIDASSTSSWKLFNDSTYGGFVPVGTSSDPFTGTFNGKGKEISGLFIDNVQEDYTGLFGKSEGAKVDSVSLTGVAVRGGYYSGALVGYMDNLSNVSNSTVSGDVYGDGSSVGGLAGVSQGVISYSTSSANVTGDAGSFLKMGGIVGSNTGEVSYSSASGYIKGIESTYHYTGGVVGSNSGKILYSKFTGTVSAETGSIIYLGGIVGHNGGVTGFCESSGLIKRESGSYGWSVGGIVGNSYEGSLHNSISSMDIAISGRNVGGVVGNQRSGSVRNVAFVGRFTAGSGQAGVVGTPNGEGYYSDVGNTYWDTTTSGVVLDSNGVGQSTSKMKEKATYVGWDFTDIWSIDEGNGYPELRWDSLDNREHRSVFYRVYSLKGIIEGPAIQWGKPGEPTNEVTAVATREGYRFKEWDDGVRTATRSDSIGGEDIVYRAKFSTYNVALDTILLTGKENRISVDSVYGTKTDTVLTITDTLIDSTNMVIQTIDTVMSGLTIRDTVVLVGAVDTSVTISNDTLFYIPTLTVDSTELSDVLVSDTVIVLDTVYQVKDDTLVSNYWYQHNTRTILTSIDSLHDGVSFSNLIDTNITKDTAVVNVTVDTLKYVPVLTVNYIVLSDISVSDTLVVLDSVIQVKDDTLVTSYWYEHETRTIKRLIDSLHDDVSFANGLDSLVTVDTTAIDTTLDTLKYIPILTQNSLIDTVTSKVEGSSYVDTSVVLDGTIGVEDTIRTLTSYSNYVDTIWTYTDSLSDGLLYAVDTSWVSLGAYLKEGSSKVDTLKYVAVLTTETRVDTISTTPILDSTKVVVDLIGDVGREDTVSTTMEYFSYEQTIWSITDSLSDDVIYGSDTTEIETGMNIYSAITNVDTAKYQDVITVLSPEESLLNYTGDLTLRVFDVFGNLVVNQKVNKVKQDDLQWNFLNSNGNRVNNGSYVVIWMFKDKLGNEKLIRSVIAVKD